MTKILYLKKKFLQILLYFQQKCLNQKYLFRLTQATNTYMHISRHKGGTMKGNRKLAHDKVF